MASLIIEGPDGSGKSYTAEHISSAVGLPLFHSGGPPKTPEEMVNRAKKLLHQHGYIYDRFPVISDKLYGPIIRNQLLFSEKWLTYIKWPIVYCRPSRETILKSELTAKPHKSAAHLEKVKERINLIISAYDLLFQVVPCIRFNRDKGTLKDLTCVVSAFLFDRTLSRNSPKPSLIEGFDQRLQKLLEDASSGTTGCPSKV